MSHELVSGVSQTHVTALNRDRVIDAVDAHTDYRTRKFSKESLSQLGTGAMLDATLRKTGQITGCRYVADE